MSLFIEINGQRITGRVDGLDNFSLTKERTQDNLKETTTFSGSLKFYDDGFNILFPILVGSPTGVSATVNVSIFDDCCNQKFDGFIISGDMVDYCSGDCFITTRLKLIDPDTAIRDMVNSICVSDNRNGFFDNTPFPKMLYCNELRPVWLHYVVLILGSILQTIVDLVLAVLLFVNQIYAVIYAICEFIVAIKYYVQKLWGWVTKLRNKLTKFLNSKKFKVKLESEPPLTWDDQKCKDIIEIKFENDQKIKDMSNALADFIIGCGCSHPSPLVRDYVTNGMTICGINGFVSSIYNNPSDERYNTVYFYAPIKRGRVPNKVGNYIKKNAPAITFGAFLDEICAAVNAEWWIDGGVLYLEPKESYLSAQIFYDAVQNASTGNILEGVCFTYNEGRNYNRLNIEYAIDSIDINGNERLDEYILRDETDDTPGLDFGKRYGYNPAWKNSNDIYIPFSAPNFRSEDEDVLDTAVMLFPLIPIFLGSRIKATTGYLKMEQNHCQNPKLLIWDGVNISNGIVKDYGYAYYGNKFLGKNYPYKLIESGQNPPVTNGSGYDAFLTLDPKMNPFRFWNYRLKVKADCYQINDLNINKTTKLMMPWGQTRNARINSLTLEYGAEGTTLTIEGEV